MLYLHDLIFARFRIRQNVKKYLHFLRSITTTREVINKLSIVLSTIQKMFFVFHFLWLVNKYNSFLVSQKKSPNKKIEKGWWKDQLKFFNCTIIKKLFMYSGNWIKIYFRFKKSSTTFLRIGIWLLIQDVACCKKFCWESAMFVFNFITFPNILPTTSLLRFGTPITIVHNNRINTHNFKFIFKQPCFKLVFFSSSKIKFTIIWRWIKMKLFAVLLLN